LRSSVDVNNIAIGLIQTSVNVNNIQIGLIGTSVNVNNIQIGILGSSVAWINQIVSSTMAQVEFLTSSVNVNNINIGLLQTSVTLNNIQIGILESSITTIGVSTHQWTRDSANTNIYNNNTGNVGIGISAPKEKLNVLGNAAFTGVVRSSGNAYNNYNYFASSVCIGTGVTPPTGLLCVSTGVGTTSIYVAQGGNVGIGTTNPTFALEVTGGVKISSTIVQDPWIEVGPQGGSEPAFKNSWTNRVGYPVAAFYRDKEGVVHLKGCINLGTLGQVAFTFPVGYRFPYSDMRVPCDGGAQLGIIQIESNGDLTPVVGGSVYIYLDGISFRASGY